MRTPSTHFACVQFKVPVFLAVGKLGHNSPSRGSVLGATRKVRVRLEAGLFVKRRIADDECRRMSQRWVGGLSPWVSEYF
jgi:hypothetical protein